MVTSIVCVIVVCIFEVTTAASTIPSLTMSMKMHVRSCKYWCEYGHGDDDNDGDADLMMMMILNTPGIIGVLTTAIVIVDVATVAAPSRPWPTSRATGLMTASKTSGCGSQARTRKPRRLRDEGYHMQTLKPSTGKPAALNSDPKR